MSLFPEDTVNYCCDPVSADTYKQRIKVAAKFCAERHRIYILRHQGKPKPWTKDPILRSYRFCNIYRELDTVTEWIMDNWINPYTDSPNIALRAILGRVINHPPTLKAMIDTGLDLNSSFNQKLTWELFRDIRDSGEKLVTGAYIVNTIFPKDHKKIDGSKADYIANFLLPQLWSKRKELNSGLFLGSFSSAIESMKQIHGVGGFIANQAATDLSYTPLLSKAKDLNTTWNPGPGTTKGIRWITDKWNLKAGTEDMNKALTKYRDDLNSELSSFPEFTSSSNQSRMKTHIVSLTAPNASNSLCELSKFVWLRLGKRERLKNTYKGS